MAKNPYHELARTLKAAVMAYRLGIGVEYCKKRYVKDENIDQSWLDLAEQLDRNMSERIAGCKVPRSKPQ